MIVWFRFLLAVLYGTYLGVPNSHRSSGANLLFGFNFIVFVPSLYCTTFLGAEQASFDNKLLTNGVVSSTALMLLLWTYFYTLEHDNDAEALAAILASSIGAGADIDGMDPDAGDVPPGGSIPESEF